MTFNGFQKLVATGTGLAVAIGFSVFGYGVLNANVADNTKSLDRLETRFELILSKLSRIEGQLDYMSRGTPPARGGPR